MRGYLSCLVGSIRLVKRKYTILEYHKDNTCLFKMLIGFCSDDVLFTFQVKPIVSPYKHRFCVGSSISTYVLTLTAQHILAQDLKVKFKLILVFLIFLKHSIKPAIEFYLRS